MEAPNPKVLDPPAGNVPFTGVIHGSAFYVKMSDAKPVWTPVVPVMIGKSTSTYKNLVFWIRIEAKSPALAPLPDSLVVAMGCSKGKKTSFNATVTKFQRQLLDGKWHKVVIPVKEFSKGKEGKEFDPGSAWEFRLSTWSDTARDFNIYFDDIALEP